MEYARKPLVTGVVEPASAILKPTTALSPESERLQRLAKLESEMYRGTIKPLHAQRQAVGPIFRASELHAQETQRLEGPRAELQRQVAEIGGHLPPQAVDAALQRWAERAVPVVAPARPQTPGDWVTVMRVQAQTVQEQQDAGRGLDSRQSAQFTGLQRQVAQTLVQGFRQDRQPPETRHAQYAEHLVSLQRHPLSASVARGVLGLMPQGERMALQRAVDVALQREREQQAQDEQALSLHAIQRQLAELDAQASQPVFERIQARRGTGNPLPEAIQRHLEQGLNTDLSRVRIHDDAEADKLAKGVNAVAFTTGSDIFFRSGTFNPNTQSGLELLAHEVTHVKQQAQGQVGPGVDPDPGLEAEARGMGAKLAQVMPSPKTLLPPSPHAPGVYSKGAALQRAQDGAAQTFALKPLLDLQPAGLQRAPDLSLQRWGNPLTWAADKAKAGLASALTAIPGYRELSLAFGRDLVTGKTMEGNPNAILDALAGFVPGPLKDVLRALRETGAIPKAWAWFKAELGKLNLGGALGEVTAAIGRADLGAAKNAITSRIGGLKNLIVGSARKIADIGLTALSAGLGPLGQQVMAKLRSSSDLMIQVLKDPAKFAGNLLNALKGGFSGFARNAPKHLQNGLGQWLTGASGITFPAKLDFQGVFLTALSVMGLTYQVLRGKLVRQLGTGGEQKVQRAEQTVGTLQTLKSGIQKADEMKASGGNIGGEVATGVKNEVTKSLVVAGITKVATMLIPGGGFINALIGAFRSVQFLIEQGKQIMGVVTSALGSVSAIAAGNIGSAVGLVESTLARSIPVALGFLSKLVGIGNIGGKIKAIIQKLKGKLDSVVDKVVARISKVVAKVLDKLPGGKSKKAASGQDQQPTAADKQQKLTAAVRAIRPEFEAMVARHASKNELQAKLGPWQSQHNLARVWMTRPQGRFTLKAQVNPKKSIGDGFTPYDAMLRTATRQAVRELLQSPKVGARAQQYREQYQKAAQGYAGSASNPFQVTGGVDTLGLIVFSRQTPITAQAPVRGRRRPEAKQSEQHYDYGTGQSVRASRWQPGTNEFVRDAGRYKDHVIPTIAQIKQATRRTDADIARDLMTFMSEGSWPILPNGQPVYSAAQRQQLATLRHLMTYTESVRSPDNIAHSTMLLDLVAAGHTDWGGAIDKLPMHVQSAAGIKRGLEVLDRKLEDASPKVAAFLRKAMPQIQKMRQMEANVVREWLGKLGNAVDGVYPDQQSVTKQIVTSMKSFYGV